jgi:hypothetical protein
MSNEELKLQAAIARIKANPLGILLELAFDTNCPTHVRLKAANTALPYLVMRTEVRS